MKICIINNIFFPYSRGGADKIARLMADGFIEAGDEVFIIATKADRKEQEVKKYQTYFIFSFFDSLKKMPKGFRLIWHFFDTFNILNYFRIRKILKNEKPKLVITHNLKGLGFLIPLAISKEKIKHLHVLHDIQLIHPSGLMNFGEEKKINSFFCKVYTLITSSLFKKVDFVISPSKWLLDFHLERNFFANAQHYITPNPVLISEHEDDKNILKNSNFIYVGELEKHKGVDLLVEVFEKLNKSEKIVEIYFFGAGSYSEVLKRKALQTNYIKYLGRVENREVLKRIKSSRALIMPSLCYENSPTVIYEACGQKTPIIASRIGGITELVHELGGILFNPGDDDDLIKKINYLIDNYSEVKLRAENSAKLLEKYNLKRYINKIKSIVK